MSPDYRVSENTVIEKIPFRKNEGSSFVSIDKRAQDTIRKIAIEPNDTSAFGDAFSIKYKQEAERDALLESHETKKEEIKQESVEARQNLLTQKAKEILYGACGVDESLEKNSGIKKFIKWALDGAILGNIEFIESVVHNPDTALESIKHLLTIEWIKQALAALGKSFMDLFRGDPYDTGKSMGELGLVAMGAGAAYGVLRKSAKNAMIQETKGVLKGVIAKPERATVMKNAALSEVERLAEAEKIIGKELTDEQKKAIIRAHKAGSGKVFEYSKPDLRQKVEILRDEAGLTRAERRSIMEHGVAGETKLKPKDIPPDTTAVPKYDGKKPHEVNNVLKEEIVKITEYQENNLEKILSDVDIHDAVEFGRLNARGNAWVRAKLGNIGNFVEYVENASKMGLSEADVISATKYLKEKIRDEALGNISEMIVKLTQEKGFQMSGHNIISLKRLAERMQALDTPIH